MFVVCANFRLEGISEAEYAAYCAEIAPRLAEVPGLRSKLWLSDPSSGRFGAVYVYESREAHAQFATTDLFHELAAVTFAADVQANGFDTLDEPTRLTGGGLWLDTSSQA